MPGPRMLVLCNIVGNDGGTESYLSRVLPALHRSGYDVRIAARQVKSAGAFGLPAEEIAWGGDDAPAEPIAALRVEQLIADFAPATVFVSNVFDAGVLQAARRVSNFIIRVHDHRAFCPQGDRMYPNFRRTCLAPMGAGCLAHAVVHGCIGGVSARTLRLWKLRSVQARAMLAADGYVVSSEFMARLCVTNGVDAAKIVVGQSPCADASFVGVSRAMPAERRVLFSGRLVRDKGAGSLIRALALIPFERRPKLDVAGAATRESRGLADAARRAGVELRLLGQLDAAGVIAAIDRARVVAVPSLWPEPFGLAGPEAFARARPVAAYASGGIGEWMGEAGVAVPPGDEAALARALDHLSEPDVWPRYSANAERQSRTYTIDAHLERIASLFERERTPATCASS